MANFNTHKFSKHDDYMTPAYAWHNIKKYIPKNKVIWEAFYGDGSSGTILKNMGFNTIHKEIDFFQHNKGDVVVSNPPFTKIPQILERLKSLNKPFIMIMPVSKMNTQYFRKLFVNTDDPIQIIIPQKRIQFLKMVDGRVDKNAKKACSFDCYYYCWKMNFSRDIIWLQDDECVQHNYNKKEIAKSKTTTVTNPSLCDDLVTHILSYLPIQQRQRIILSMKYGKCHSRIKVAICKNNYLNTHFIPGSSYKRYERISHYDKNLKLLKTEYRLQLRFTKTILKRTKCFVTIQEEGKSRKYKIVFKNNEEIVKGSRPLFYRNEFTRFVGNSYRLTNFKTIQRKHTNNLLKH